MGKFNTKSAVSSDAVSQAVSDAVSGAGLVTNSDLTSALAGKADSLTVSMLSGSVSSLSTNVSAVADDLLSTVGRKLLLDPSNVTGSGGAGTEVEHVVVLTLPSGLSLSNGSKYRFNGTTLVRTPGGQRIAEIALRDQIMMYSAFPAWNPTDQGAGTYDIGWRVTNEGHGWQSTVNDNAAQPTVASHVGWTDLGVGAIASWEEVMPGTVDPTMETGADSYFGAPGDLPALGSTGVGDLVLFLKPTDGQTVRVEFDGSIASVGGN